MRTVRRRISIPLAVKLTAEAEDPLALAAIAIQEGADMLVFSGRVQGFMPDLETHGPILGSWGAIGGRWALPASLYWVSKCWRMSQPRSIIGTNGARSGEDVLRFLLSGARAVELASAAITNGAKIFSEIIADIESYCEGKQIRRLGELIGKAADSSSTYKELPSIKRQRYPWER